MQFLLYNVPSGHARFSTFDELGKRNTIALKKILDSGQDDGVEAVKKVIDLYQSCLNTTAIDLADATPLLELLNHTGIQGYQELCRMWCEIDNCVLAMEVDFKYFNINFDRSFSLQCVVTHQGYQELCRMYVCVCVCVWGGGGG